VVSDVLISLDYKKGGWDRSVLMSVKPNALAYTFLNIRFLVYPAEEKYVDSCGTKGLDETRRSQTEGLI